MDYNLPMNLVLLMKGCSHGHFLFIIWSQQSVIEAIVASSASSRGINLVSKKKSVWEKRKFQMIDDYKTILQRDVVISPATRKGMLPRPQ